MVPDTGYPIYIGDLLFQDPTSYNARSAASMADQGTNTLNQQTFHRPVRRRGLAARRRADPSLNPESQGGAEVSFNLNPLPPQLIVAAGRRRSCSTVRPRAWHPGDLVAISRPTPNGLSPQTVVKTTNRQCAIGYAVPLPNAIGQSRTTVAVRIKSSLTGGFPFGQTEPSSSGKP